MANTFAWVRGSPDWNWGLGSRCYSNACRTRIWSSRESSGDSTSTTAGYARCRSLSAEVRANERGGILEKHCAHEVKQLLRFWPACPCGAPCGRCIRLNPAVMSSVTDKAANRVLLDNHLAFLSSHRGVVEKVDGNIV